MDLLQDRLFRARASGAVFARSRVLSPWGLRLPPDTQLAVHAMIDGEGWLWLDDPRRPVRLRAGDLVLVRGTLLHHLADRPGRPCLDLGVFPGMEGAAVDGGADWDPSPVGMTDAEPGDRVSESEVAEFLCGAYRFSGDVGKNLIEALPPVLPVSPEPGGRLSRLVRLLADELTGAQPGQPMVLDRLLDVLLVQLIRDHFSAQGATPPPWYTANNHRRLRPALQAMHDDPGHGWTVAELAQLASVPRATFARTFVDVLGQTPMEYLTDWRMSLARDDLLTSDLPLASIADRYGYGSPYAFSAAFHRRHGASPGRWRSRAGEPGREGW